jgi:hypothetical protein
MKENMETNRKAIPVKDIEHASEAGKRQRDFDDLLVDSVDEAVTEILGADVTPILWRYWTGDLGITRENMPNHLLKLFESIQTIFGAGGETVGEQVIKRLYTKANIPLEYSHVRPLEEYAEKLKQILAKDFKQL